MSGRIAFGADDNRPVLVSRTRPLPVTPIGGADAQAAPGVVRGRAYTPTATFSRPNDTAQYLANDVIGSAVSANIEVPNAGAAGSLIQVLSVELTLNRTTLPTGMAGIRVLFWDAARSAIADNAPFAASAADRLLYCGRADLPTPEVVGGGFVNQFADYTGRPIRLKTTSLWLNLLTLAAITGPAALTEYELRLQCVELGA